MNRVSHFGIYTEHPGVVRRFYQDYQTAACPDPKWVRHDNGTSEEPPEGAMQKRKTN